MTRETGKRPAPFSVRLTPQERSKLEKLAGTVPLGTFIRDALLKGTGAPRRRTKNPVQDHEALGRVLGALGQSRLASNLNQLAKAVHTGSLPVTPETEEAIQEACADVRQIRSDLLRSLGLSGETGS